MMRPIVGFAPRLAALYAAMFAMLGIQLPFFPVWLKAKGLDAQMIGVVLAIPMIVRVFAIPIAARVADRRDALRAAIVIASCASVVGYAMIGFAAGAVAIVVAYGLASLAFTPVMPLTETYALRGLSARGQAYGPVRLWGSAAFIAGSFLAGYATDVMPARELIWLIVAALLITALAAYSLAPLSPAPAQPAASRDRAQVAAARSRFHRRAGGGEPDPGEPRRLLRFLGACNGAPPASTAPRSPGCGRSASLPRSCCSRSPAACRRRSRRSC